MLTNGTIFIKEKTILFCIGNEIKPETKCKKLSINGRTYDSIGSSVSNSISDVLSLGIVLQGEIDIPDGLEVTIIE